MLMNAFNCRFQLWIADAFTRYTVQMALITFVGIIAIKIVLEMKP